MATIIIDDNSYEGKAFIELLKKMSFARVIEQEHEDDWWKTISEKERQAINKGIADIEAGRTIPHQEMRKRYEQWL